MKKLGYAFFLITLSVILVRAQEKTDALNDFTVSDPYTYKNLSVYLIRGKDTAAGQKFLTLQEALGAKTATIYETGNVNELTVSNSSATHNIFILAGDIVKGGKQDRVIQYSYAVPPKTEKMRISSFCVEQGRWQQRGREDKTAFRSSADLIASKELKMSVKKEKSQSKVWENVSKMQDKLGGNLRARVKGEQSETSLQLTLEHKELKKAEMEYSAYFDSISGKNEDVVGYAFVINGKINSAEVFASKVLFRKLWPKLIKASIVEAISEYDRAKAHMPPAAGEIKRFMADSEKGKQAETKRVSNNILVNEKESDENVLFETRDSKYGGKWINKSYLKK